MTRDRFPMCRRSDNVYKIYAYRAKIKGKIQYANNGMVIPHSPYLLKNLTATLMCNRILFL